MKHKTCLAALVVALFFAASAAYGDETKSNTCKACHGDAGVSANDQWPNLAGQKKQYLVEQLRAFRAGVRFNPLMSPVAKMLSDSDIDDLASYYAALGAK